MNENFVAFFSKQRDLKLARAIFFLAINSRPLIFKYTFEPNQITTSFTVDDVASTETAADWEDSPKRLAGVLLSQSLRESANPPPNVQKLDESKVQQKKSYSTRGNLLLSTLSLVVYLFFRYFFFLASFYPVVATHL